MRALPEGRSRQERHRHHDGSCENGAPAKAQIAYRQNALRTQHCVTDGVARVTVENWGLTYAALGWGQRVVASHWLTLAGGETTPQRLLLTSVQLVFTLPAP